MKGNQQPKSNRGEEKIEIGEANHPVVLEYGSVRLEDKERGE